MRAFLILVCFVAAQKVLAQSNPSNYEPANVIQRRNWVNQNIAVYDLTITRTCICSGDPQNSFLLRVRGNQIESSVPDTEFGRSLPTVLGLFELTIQSSKPTNGSVYAEYDRALGYPYYILDMPDFDPNQQIEYQASVTVISREDTQSVDGDSTSTIGGDNQVNNGNMVELDDGSDVGRLSTGRKLFQTVNKDSENTSTV